MPLAAEQVKENTILTVLLLAATKTLAHQFVSLILHVQTILVSRPKGAIISAEAVLFLHAVAAPAAE